MMGAVASSPAPIRFRPMPLPELLDELFRLYRRHFSVFAGISLLLVVPALVTSLLSGSYRTNPIGLFVQYVSSGGGAAALQQIQAQQAQQKGPAGPSLSEVLGSSAALPEVTATKKGGSTFDTLNGNVLAR